MWWRWWVLVLLATSAAGKGKKHRHQKPGRALLDRLTSTNEGEVVLSSDADGLLPPPLDVGPYVTVTANATCGSDGAEEYCRDTPGKRGVVCDICEGADGSSVRRHPPSHAVDGDPNTWWQSPTFASGEEYAHVEFIATLPAKMELLHVIIKSGPSPRPLAWSLEISSSGDDDWHMVRAFGDKEHCRKLWNLRPERRRRKARGARKGRADKPTCSSEFASPKPLENGQMHVNLGPGVVARAVRVSLQAAHASPARRRYYTLRALTLAARCLCPAHTRHCTVDDKGARCAARPCGVDDTGAVVCVNCTENRAGPLCDRCLPGFYSALPDAGCRPCLCHPEGSNGTCYWNKKSHQISCSCHPGFAGNLCDSCEDPAAVFPNCLTPTEPACKCDPRGIVDPTRICDEVCECKKNVIGDRCDTCAPEHFGLSAARAEGCARCYCSRAARVCALDLGPRPALSDIIFPLGEAWLVRDAQENQTLESSVDEQGKPYIVSYEVEGWEHFYWYSSWWSGQQLSRYGHELRARVFWSVVRGDTEGAPTRAPDFILVAADGTKLYSAETSHETAGAGAVTLTTQLLEHMWRRADARAHAPRALLLDVLRDLRALMLRAHFHYDQDEVRLESVRVQQPQQAVERERCSCPSTHTGAHCEGCAWGAVALAGQCLPCACNGHAHCDSIDGPCGPCQHNTTGPHCERCLPGHYGNPVKGACKPCACPLRARSNNFSPNCALAAARGDDYVCTQCPDGYTGDHCELCDFGYWGSPTTEGSSCQKCDCAGAPCDRDTGLCLTCPENTEGARCDQCKEGYWFGPEGWRGAGSACEACGCGAGALAAACDAATGHCACREGWAGRVCDHCADGHGGVEEGCPACRCGVAAHNNSCEPRSGACACAAGAAPPRCDRCLSGHYGLGAGGCAGCNCSRLGAEGNACDIRTGQCRCRPNVVGRACDTCEVGYWGLQLGGCRRCECGAGAAACDPVSGACACAAGVGGAQCDRCLPGYYGFRPAGCLPCPTCSDGKICSLDTGQCVCPPRTRGPECKQCAPGYWSRENGCQPCTCGAGATSNTCDPVSGHCKCRTGWAGSRCERCAPGHFGPRCRPCDCSLDGSRDCVNGSCSCDELGRCLCKENVVGDKCDQCLNGTFGLSSENPSGCTACFCFGRAAHCTQAALTRAALHNTNPMHVTLLKGDQITTVDIHSPLAVPMHNQDVTISLPWPPAPVYVELDNRFPGDRITSYGGLLRYTVEEEGGEELSMETKLQAPLVSMYSGDIVLDYYENDPNKNGSHAVRFHESLWWVRGRGVKANRAALMVVLQKLQRVLIRVTSRAPTKDDHVHALLLNVSLDTAIPGLSRTAAAVGVERCVCSEGYASDSCQRPARGYWLPQQRIRLGSTDGTVIIAIEGEAKRCDCNGRAVACDPDTGTCLNCRNGTGGAHCETCAAGFHGSARAGGCAPCPCPSRLRNFADSCEFRGGALRCLCKPGYTGMECEHCASGWHRAEDGSCAACACDARGAETAACDRDGRCRCLAFATGLKCDRCRAPRTYLEDGECKQCDNCTQTLLDSVEELTTHLQRNANPTELSRIPKPFPTLREFSRNATELKTRLSNYRNETENSRNLDNIMHRLEVDEHRIFTDTNTFKTEALKRRDEATSLSLESMSGLEEVIKQRRKIGEQVEALDEFARGERHLSAHKALKEGRLLFRHISDIKLMDYLRGANDVFDAAHLQSTSVLEYKYRIDDLYKRVQSLQAKLDDWEQKTDDYPKLADVVWSAGDSIAAMSRGIRPRLSAVRDAGLRCRLVLEDITTLSAHNLTDEAHSAVLLAQALAIKFPSLTSELATLMLAAEEKEGILYNLTPVYKEKYLKSVETHVADLNQKATQYKSLFADTRAASSLGVSAARAWSEVADELREAATAADAALSTASAAASLAKGARPVTSPGMDTSYSLKQRGAEVLARAEEVRKQLEHLIRSADAVSVSLRGLGWAERELGAAAGPPPPREALAAAGKQADRVFVTTRALYDEASELRQKMRYQLRRQLAELQRHGDTALGAAQEHVSQISSNTVRGAELAQALATAARARAHEREATRARAQPVLRALRDAVARARHAAQTISVSVTSAPGASVGCSRAYLIRSHSPTVTRLSLALSFDGVVRDGVLLYLAGDDRPQDRKSYMRLFVHNKRLRLRWDLGAGEGHIHHPEELLPTHDDTVHTTYRIEIERIWNTVHLRVERAGSPVVSASNSSSARADTLRAARLWLGREGDAGGGALPACVHALHADDSVVGLWNFAEQPKEAKCTGCTQRWVGPRGGPGALCALGGGYVELKRSSLRAPDSRHFSLALTFRTRDRDALLFMALDAAHNRSISVWLQSCRVMFAVQYSGSRLQMTAGGAHCDGRLAHVQAIRVFAGNQLEKGSLRVNGEETLGSPSPPVQSAAALPDLTNAPYWVGGLPPGAGVEAPAPPLLGCIGAVSVDREGYNLMDTPTRHAVEPNCGTRVLRSAVFEGAGFAELPSPGIRRRGAVGLSFSSRSPAGLLLYRAPAPDEDDRHYLALLLVDGDLEVTASTGKEELKLRTNGTRFDDQRLHVVKLMRVHKQLEMWVDGKRVHSGALIGPAFAGRARGLFVGGLPAGYRGVSPGALQGLTGTIVDVIVDTQVVGFETAVQLWGATAGRAARAPHAPRALHAQHALHADTLCTKTPSYAVESGAAKFGDAAGSHAAVRLPAAGRLTLSLQFRTMRSEGILVLIPGSKAKPKHYTALCVRARRLRLVVRGRRRKEISLPEPVDDGGWRTVSVRIWRGRISLSQGAGVDGARAHAHAAPAARAHRLYVGGLPADRDTLAPHLPHSIVRVGGFRGCVRRVIVNGRQEELVRDTKSHHALGQCFPNIERGAYFAGDAYATWSSNWSWGGEVTGGEAGEDGGETLEVSLHFRTAKPNGVLVAAKPLLLELRDGQVVLSRQPVEQQAGAECVSWGEHAALCDNTWHRVRARASRGGLALAVDDAPAARRAGLGALLDDAAPPRPAPLYVGGLPEGAADVGETGRENFKGCLRDVAVGGAARDWTEMEATHNVLLDSCPVQQ
ncbi:laminin subunit alpha-2 [Plodia interpunctella]|uniref:laminin subunit alpha-2 n=1 Tax=Plodia interpunctella TaxID=58824 RepID=UPI002367C3C6|nr:laminin subunit alpha-2 [Plodia interpunctella]XP_053606001.1 laminin subunit alpha-2 [Plodia interpunctella]XP_053606009.1 laminin subunit alpha-2 [Plodia interpunctella]